MPARVPASRIRALNAIDPRPDEAYVLYWMTAFRRLDANFALQRALELCREFRRPLVVLEAIRAAYPWASDRLHGFVIDGMAEHARALAGSTVLYYPYVEPAAGAARGLLEALGASAVAIVTDDFPAFFLPRMQAAAAARVSSRLESVDSNGLLPIRATEKSFQTALSFRAHLQQELPAQLGDWPARLDLTDLPRAAPDLIPGAVHESWPAASFDQLAQPQALLASVPIDHGVGVTGWRGGSTAAREALDNFVRDSLATYAERHSHPDDDGTSRLSPWLHFGHISAHQVFEAVMTASRWTSRSLSRSKGGKRSGWWGAPAGVEAFLDQLVTWRELGFNLCVTRPDDYDRIESIPAWARATLDDHRRDQREHLYTRDQLERADTHDEVWNAAQRQLTRDGWMHNYLRMLWGKKILEWTSGPEVALDTMVALMDKHAIDGRDPNSYNGYGWVLGRFDRPWGPKRPIFGTVRYMSSANTVKKLRMKRYLADYGPGAATGGLFA